MKPLNEIQDELKSVLGRDVTVSKVRVGPEEKYLADYVNHGAPATKLAGLTEEEAIRNLHDFLTKIPSVKDETLSQF